MSGQRVTVLYIAGMRRSGSTILDSLLGQVDGLFSVGELQWIWHLVGRNSVCGCGRRFDKCETWGSILEAAFGGVHRLDLDHLGRSAQRLRYQLPSLKLGRFVPSLDAFADIIEKLYLAISGVTGSRVIVDSSKSPPYGYLLSALPSLEIYVLQLVRDPRGVAYSVIRKLERADASEQEWMRANPTSPSQLAFEWVAANLLSTRTAWPGADQEHHKVVRYEEFVSLPQSQIQDILDFVHTPNDDLLPFTGAQEIQLRPTHTVSGNRRIAFQQGRVALKPDVEWITQMKKRDRNLVSLLTWPLLRKYNYPTLARHMLETSYTPQHR